VSGSLERFLIDRGETVVRLPPRLMADARHGVRERGSGPRVIRRAGHRASGLVKGRGAGSMLRPARRPQPRRPLAILLDQPRLRSLELPRMRRPRRRLRCRTRCWPHTPLGHRSADRVRPCQAAHIPPSPRPPPAARCASDGAGDAAFRARRASMG
jgi:hypothetical protein